MIQQFLSEARKQEALATVDAYAEIFGPRFAWGRDYDANCDCCCTTGALALFLPVVNDLFLSVRLHYGLWPATDNDRFAAETPEQRFARMRLWLADLPVAI